MHQSHSYENKEDMYVAIFYKHEYAELLYEDMIYTCISSHFLALKRCKYL